MACPGLSRGAIIFDLTKIAPPRTRTPNLSAEDMLRAYELAESGSLLPVMAPRMVPAALCFRASQ